jgi:hypothetical protein
MIYNCKHPLQFQRGLTSGRQPVVIIISESLSRDWKHVVPTLLGEIKVGKIEEEAKNNQNILILQVLAHFGPYIKKREELLHEKRVKSELLDDNKVQSYVAPNKSNGTEVPKIKDVLGEALPRIGTYKHLDNVKQVVALIDDVSWVK